MILGNIGDIKRYLNINKNLDEAIHFIMLNDISNLETGRIDIGEFCYVNVMDYTIDPEEKNPFEAHKLWGDIHLTAAGEEAIGITDMEHLNVTVPYDEKRDIFFGETDDFTTFCLDSKHFAIVFADDPHRVKIFKGSKNVRKVVFKFKL